MILLLTPLQLFKTLSDDTRLSIVLLLREMGELCVCDIGAALDAPQPKISRHLGMLRDAGVLLDRKEGHYRLSPQMPAWAARVIEEAWEADRTAARKLASKLTSVNGTADGKSCCG
jgi:ArsR family transcriptional regulator